MIMDPIVAENNSASEFTKMVSRGRLAFSNRNYIFMVEDKKCSAVFCKLLQKCFRDEDFRQH